jgi:hypothetical protein
MRVFDPDAFQAGDPWIIPHRAPERECNRRIGVSACRRASEGEGLPAPKQRLRHAFLVPPSLKEAGVTGYVWHCNRHTFCSWLAIAGVPLKTIQELAGHKTISITAQYAHLCPDHKQSEVEKMLTPPARNVVSIRSATHTANGDSEKVEKIG